MPHTATETPEPGTSPGGLTPVIRRLTDPVEPALAAPPLSPEDAGQIRALLPPVRFPPATALPAAGARRLNPAAARLAG